MSLTQGTWEVLLGAVPLCVATSPGGRMQISCRGFDLVVLGSVLPLLQQQRFLSI